jgi:oligopeptide transport system substrate-binding protein
MKQELRLNLGGEPGTLDPHRASSPVEFSVIRQVFQGLLGFKPDLTLEPGIATQVPTVDNGGISPDGLIYTFNLRKDAAWSDGRPVTARDFAYSLRRLLDPEVAAPLSFLYLIIEGAQRFNNAARDLKPEALVALREAVGVEALDDHTLRITLERPSPTLLQKMALVPAYPVRQDIVEAAGEPWTEVGRYVGNGPYIMTEWVHQDHITLEASPNYWGPRPTLRKIALGMITDVNAELAAYQRDELDLAQVPPGAEGAILADPNLAQQLLRTPSLTTFGLFFNTREAPFDDVKVRQAFTTAIDRDAWIHKVKGGAGRPATSWLPPGLPGYDPALGGEYTFDRARAADLLAGAGFPGGAGLPTVTLTYVEAEDQRLMSQFLQSQIRENLGVEVVLESLDPVSYGQKVVGARKFQMTPFGWVADYPDAEDFFSLLFVTGAPINITGYSNAELDRTAALAASKPDQEKRIELWEGAHHLLVEDAPVAFLFYGESFHLKKPRVQGLTPTGIDGIIPGETRLSEVFIIP